MPDCPRELRSLSIYGAEEVTSTEGGDTSDGRSPGDPSECLDAFHFTANSSPVSPN